MQKKCEKTREKKKKLEQDVVTLKSHINMNMIGHSQVEQYQQATEERVRQNLKQRNEKKSTYLCRLICCSVMCLKSLSLYITFQTYTTCVFPLPPLEQLVL